MANVASCESNELCEGEEHKKEVGTIGQECSDVECNKQSHEDSGISCQVDREELSPSDKTVIDRDCNKVGVEGRTVFIKEEPEGCCTGKENKEGISSQEAVKGNHISKLAHSTLGKVVNISPSADSSFSDDFVDVVTIKEERIEVDDSCSNSDCVQGDIEQNKETEVLLHSRSLVQDTEPDSSSSEVLTELQTSVQLRPDSGRSDITIHSSCNSQVDRSDLLSEGTIHKPSSRDTITSTDQISETRKARILKCASDSELFIVRHSQVYKQRKKRDYVNESNKLNRRWSEENAETLKGHIDSGKFYCLQQSRKGEGKSDNVAELNVKGLYNNRDEVTPTDSEKTQQLNSGELSATSSFSKSKNNELIDESHFPSSVQEYKRKHNIGLRASSENVTTYKESAFLFSSPDVFYSQHSSPTKSPIKSPQKQYDSGIDMDFSATFNKKAVVHMGERVSLEGHSLKVKDKSATKKMSKKKKTENLSLPSRRVKRQASLNATAMVNILFEKEKPLPKSPKRKTPDAKKSFPEFTESSDSYCNKKSSASKSETSSVQKKERVSEEKKIKDKKLKKTADIAAKRKMQNLKAILKRNKELKRLEKAKRKKEKKEQSKLCKGTKRKHMKDIKSKKRKLSTDKSDDKMKVKRPRTDTRRAARTHVQVTPKKRRFSGSTCASCLQPISVQQQQQQGSAYWTSQQMGDNSSRNNSESEEMISQTDRDVSSLNNPYSISRMQQMDGSLPMMQHLEGSLPRMQQLDASAYVLPHSHIPYCHQCAPHTSTMISTPCQYALGGVGSMGSVPMMPYQAFGGAYPISYQATPATIPHCACAACYQAAYYPQTGSLIQHQSLPSHDPCLHPLNMQSPKRDEKEDEIIDVGEAEKVPRPQRARLRTEKEKERRESTEKKNKSSDLHKELTIQIPDSNTKPPKSSLSSGKKGPKLLDGKKGQKRPKSLNIVSPTSSRARSLKSPGLKSKRSPSVSAKSPSMLSPKSPALKVTKAVKSPKSPRAKVALPSPSAKTKSSNDKTTKSVKLMDQKKTSPGATSKSTDKKAKYNRTVSRHGWTFHGIAEKRKFMSQSLGYMLERDCYPEIRHVDGDVIHVRDCVLLRSGPKDTDIPYVAKVTAFWEHPHDGEVMMSLLWFYHPEHTEGGRKSHHAHCELFASKHKDENSVACIDDKGYVLTYNEYCRYKAERRRLLHSVPSRPNVVPVLESGYFRSSKLPPHDVDDHNVFMCRQVYDFKLKRILKNPS